MDWRLNFRAEFRNLRDDECKAWEAWLNERVPDCKAEEIDAAVEKIARTWEVKERGVPRVRHIYGAIMGSRRHMRGGVELNDLERDIMRRMIKATPEGRWPLVCEWPDRDPEGWERLRLYADSLPGGLVQDYGPMDELVAKMKDFGRDSGESQASFDGKKAAAHEQIQSRVEAEDWEPEG